MVRRERHRAGGKKTPRCRRLTNNIVGIAAEPVSSRWVAQRPVAN
jgi:hypothetical protein